MDRLKRHIIYIYIINKNNISITNNIIYILILLYYNIIIVIAS